MKDYLNRGNCEQLLKHPLIRDCQEKQVKLQIKEYLDKIRKIRRGSSSTSNDVLVVPSIQQIQSDDEEEDDDDDDDDHNDRQESREEGDVQINEERIRREREREDEEDLHPTTRENCNHTLRENFKCVQHSSSKLSFSRNRRILSFFRFF